MCTYLVCNIQLEDLSVATVHVLSVKDKSPFITFLHICHVKKDLFPFIQRERLLLRHMSSVYRREFCFKIILFIFWEGEKQHHLCSTYQKVFKSYYESFFLNELSKIRVCEYKEIPQTDLLIRFLTIPYCNLNLFL